jgi:hypothetical protein
MSIKYIILYIFILIIIININYYSIDGFTEKKRMAIIIRGESFRIGSQGNRNIGSNESYEQQKVASATHNKLAEKIESLGYTVDIYIDSYSTKYDNDLLSFYGSRVKKYKFHTSHLESQQALIKDSINLLEDSLNNYEVLLIIRMDLFLKDQYINEYNPDVKTIQFISPLWIATGKTLKGNPRVNDVILHYPKDYYNKLDILYTNTHKNHMHDMLDNTDLIYYTNYSFLTNNFHDSDSQKDFNPYYKMISRLENSVWHDVGKKFPNDFIDLESKSL